MADILEGLNEEQRQAAMHVEGPLLVVAGAGTGKTQVITRRIAYLLQNGHAKPGEVLALTFTEKAAREMEERLYGLIGWESFSVPIMTFNAFGSELLGRFASHIGRSVRGGLLNDTQKALLLRQHISEIRLEYYGPQQDMFEFLEGIVAYINNLQNAGVDADKYDEFVTKLRSDPGEMHERDVAEQGDLAKLYRLYDDVKLKTGTFDYNDQLHIPLEILRERANLAERLAHEYKFVLVDEYQDTNSVQDQLLRTFIGSNGNLFAVGDDDQAIYGFRGADIANILDFAQHFDVKEPAVLVKNYRSGQEVLDAAYRLIQHNNPERLEAKLGLNKRLVAVNGHSEVEFVPYRTPADEQAGILAELERRLKSGEPAKEMAVLAATHAPLKALAKSMRSRGLAYALSTSANIFEQPELIGLWYLLKWLVWQADDEAIGHVVMGPFFGWTPGQYSMVLGRSREHMVSVEEALRLDESDDARRLIGTLDEWRKWAATAPVSRLAFQLVFETGRAEAWRELAMTSARMVRVFEDLQRLLDQMQDFESVVVDTTLAGYFSMFPKPPALEVSEPVGYAEGVQLVTVHASKGLEFETVLLMSCTQRTWSKGRGGGREVPENLKPAKNLPPEHEFRRLMYVAATRARRNLLVSAPMESVGGVKQALSPLVTELMGKELSSATPVMSVSDDRLQKVMDKLQRYYPLKGLNKDRLPFEDGDGWLDLSVTQLGSYVFCPFDFYLEHVLAIRQPAGPQMAFGSVIHKVFERFYKAKMAGTKVPAAELHVLLDELWSSRGYERRELADADRELAHETVERFLRREQNEPREVVASEMGVRFELPEAKLRIRGKIDALFRVEGGVEIRDFKTGRTKTDSEKLAKNAKENFQLRTYALSYEMMNGAMPAQVVLDYVVTGIEGTAKLSPLILQKHREKLGSLAQKIRTGEFTANASVVHSCAAIKFYGTGEYDELAQEILAETPGGAR